MCNCDADMSINLRYRQWFVVVSSASAFSRYASDIGIIDMSIDRLYVFIILEWYANAVVRPIRPCLHNATVFVASPSYHSSFA